MTVLQWAFIAAVFLALVVVFAYISLSLMMACNRARDLKDMWQRRFREVSCENSQLRARIAKHGDWNL